MSDDQDALNDFVRGLRGFLVDQLRSLFDAIELVEESPAAVQLWLNRGGDDEILVSTEDCELTVAFGETHWHINTYSRPLDLESMKLSCVRDLVAVLQGELVTYSVWSGDRALGGGSCRGEEDPKIKGTALHAQADAIRVKVYRQPRVRETLVKP